MLPLQQVAMRVVIHKEGLAMEAFLTSSLLSYNQWLKIFFQFFKRKEKQVKVKLGRKQQIEKVEKIKMDICKEIEKSDKSVGC